MIREIRFRREIMSSGFVGGLRLTSKKFRESVNESPGYNPLMRRLCDYIEHRHYCEILAVL